jgi:hypothetical protein
MTSRLLVRAREKFSRRSCAAFEQQIIVQQVKIGEDHGKILLSNHLMSLGLNTQSNTLQSSTLLGMLLKEVYE